MDCDFLVAAATAHMYYKKNILEGCGRFLNVFKLIESAFRQTVSDNELNNRRQLTRVNRFEKKQKEIV